MKFKHPFDISFSDAEEYSSFLKAHKKTLNGQVMSNHGLGLINIGLALYRLVFAKAPTKSTVKVIKHFAREIHYLYCHNGMMYLIKYLKTSSVMLQQYVARNEVLHNSRAIGKVAVSSTRKGLPRIIPSLQRALIRKGHVQVITFWLSLLNIYRYLEGTHKNPLYPRGKNDIERPGESYVLPPDTEMYMSNF